MSISPGSIGQRLRAARLRPTMARIGALQTVEAAAPERLCAEEVFRRMMLRGTHASIGTVYRTLQQLEAVGLLRKEWGAGRKAFYGLGPVDGGDASLRLVCGHSGRSVLLDDPELHARLVALASAQGMDLAGQTLTLQTEARPRIVTSWRRRS
ncbi:Fur family transcriptional regulator [Variovorax sp. LT1R16]|uniref:Fur family transcriptional regulator n=1 Tax=Variovorax sp. LT1R16 TaxID=3443728 RepID=UPI003F47B148